METGARNNKLKVYEMVEHPAARALTGYLLVRGGVHQVAYARALEKLTGADLMKLFPSPRIPTDKIPECQPHIKRGEHLKLYRFSPEDFQEIKAVFNGPHPETGEDLMIADEISPEGAPPFDLPSQPAVFAPGTGSRDARGGLGQAAQGRRAAQEAHRSGRQQRQRQRRQRRRRQGQGRRQLRDAVPAVAPRDAGRHRCHGHARQYPELGDAMAELTHLDEKLAEVLGLAQAAQAATKKVATLARQEKDTELLELLERMDDEAAKVEQRCDAATSSRDGVKTAITGKARETKAEVNGLHEDLPRRRRGP